MRIAIYGAGGLGGYYGARLVRAGNAVAFIARGAHLDAIRERGLQVYSPLGDIHVPKPVATGDPAEVGPVDLVLVAVKTWQIPDVAAAMGPLLGDGTVVLPLLNGVEASDELAAVIGAGRVLGGLSKVFSKIESPGVIRQFHTGAFVAVGELDGGDSERVRVIGETFSTAGIDVAVSREIRIDLWKKLLLVSSWAGLAALARSPMGVMRAEPGTRALIDCSIDEGLAVARATGARRRPGVQGRDVGLLPCDAGRSDRIDATRPHGGKAVGAGGVERRDMPVRRRGRGRDTGALVHVQHPAADGAEGPGYGMSVNRRLRSRTR